jgi:hypothetical protein
MPGDTLMRLLARLGLQVAIAATVFSAAGCSDDREHQQKLEALVQRGANRADVAAELGPGYTMYENDAPSWNDLMKFLDREPAKDLLPLRENVKKYPKVMYYTTQWRMTWIFFDDKDVIRAYYLTAQ